MAKTFDPVPVDLVSRSSSSGPDLHGLLEATLELYSQERLTSLLEMLLEIGARFASAQRGFLLLWDPRAQRLETRFTRPVDTPAAAADVDVHAVAKRCLEGARTLMFPTMSTGPGGPTPGSGMVSPLKTKESWIGVMVLDRPSAVGAFKSREVSMVEELCRHASLAIDRIRVTEGLRSRERHARASQEELEAKNGELRTANEQLERRLTQLGAMESIDKGVSRGLSLDELLALILRTTVDLLGVTKGSLLLVNEENQSLELKSVLGPDVKDPDKPAAVRLKIGEGIAGAALRTGAPVAINDGHKNRQFKKLFPEDSKIQNLLCVPLVTAGRKVGVINLVNKPGSSGFTDPDRELVILMAHQAALAIENARLFDLSVFDALTGLFQARHFHANLTKELLRARRYRANLSIAVLSVDGLDSPAAKRNGAVRDVILRKVAKVLRGVMRNVDMAGRVGDNEFAVALPQTSLDGAQMFAERIHAAVQKARVEIGEVKVAVTVSVGVASSPANPAQSKDQLFDLARAALGQAREAGINQTKVCEERTGSARSKVPWPTPEPTAGSR